MRPPAFSGPLEWIVYVTYTREGSTGIHGFQFQPATGRLTPLGLAAETASPSFIAVHPTQRFVYAANEISDGSISGFSVDFEMGRLMLLNRVSSRGAGPCYVALDRTGKWLFAANYVGGSVAVFPVHADGSLGESSAFVQHSGASLNPERQSGPHPHSADVSADNRFLLVADLGLDRLLVYRFDAVHGALTPNDPPFVGVAPGAGPRHVAFRPDGRFAYLIHEMMSTVTTYGYDSSRGSLEEIQTVSTLPAGFTGQKSGAGIAVHPGGEFLYASNRGHDSIAVFRIDAEHGTVTTVDRISTQGKTPRHFAIDPTGAYLFAANQDSHNIVVFRVDRKTGGLTNAGDILRVASPACVVFVKVR